jgi:CheY-like chemotaxis protein
MLVEDDDMVRKMSGDILTGLGYTVLEAENGEDALQVCSRSQGKVDLLLSDVVMPKMSGPALATKMQELCPETKVLFMSGYTENDIVKHGVLEDGVNFIPKPITPRSLSQAVRKVLG